MKTKKKQAVNNNCTAQAVEVLVQPVYVAYGIRSNRFPYGIYFLEFGLLDTTEKWVCFIVELW